MDSKRDKPAAAPTAFLPLATAFESLSKRRLATGGIDAVAVQKALNLRSLFLAQRLLVALGGNGRRFETPEEFATVAQKLMAGSPGSKVEFLFYLHDVKGDGWLDREELDCLMHIAIAEHDLRISPREVDQLVDAVMRAGDSDGNGKITIGEFAQLMSSHPELQRRLMDYGVALLMPGQRARAHARAPGSAWSGWLRNGALLATWLVAYVGVNLALFAWAVLRYRDAGANLYIQVARGAGACLNFNAALIVVPMLRHTLTWVRRSVLGRVVPVDDAIDVHGLIGGVVLLFSLIHGVAHALNAHAVGHVDLATFVTLTRTNLTGAVLLWIFVAMWLFSRPLVRRSGHFELFHVTHLGYLVAVPLTFMHGPHFWMWGTVPWAWWGLERLARSSQRRARSRIVTVTPMASGVTRLDIERPRGFRYAAGDYVFLRVPAVARTEWHPFTLTSAPEDPERLTVHVRALGNWTRALGETLDDRERDGLETYAHIDGPYGSATRHIFETKHAVAIAAGIGVTPFASILQSLLLGHGPSSPLRKLRFVWLARDQYSFEWFRELLGELEKRDVDGLLDIHIYMTSGRADLGGSILDVAQVLRQAQRKGDVVTGLRTHTSMGTPDFDKLLESFYRDPGLPRPQVFFCGPKPLERIVARSCERLHLAFRSERF
ncbi:MAG TPA: EF-hand domain-containing protein [Polyangia bacterium]|nr:EF-hand domain-containing protein [Polyangia bacterium]